jgi:uncharacterized radical SAM superfamily Fe-S cluster-containing enzyme
MPERDYHYIELTNAICSRCLRKAEAKIIERGGQILMLKHCAQHGEEAVLLATDPDYWRLARGISKPSEMPLRFNTPVKHGCPYDCGLCEGHEQHSCLALVEITDACNLTCPVCYAASAPGLKHRPMAQIEKMLDAIVANEGEPSIVQISGGEPTIHPQFFEVLDAARRRPIKHLMVNTNGLRIAQDREFAKRLAGYMPGFEVYMQFDSLRPGVHKALRGLDLTDTHRRALDHLNEFNISTTLVCVVKRGENDDELGEIIEYALKQRCVRGLTLQPVQAEGRFENHDPVRDRLTLTEVRQRVIEQSAHFTAKDIVPVPCHPDCIAMAYALKLGKGGKDVQPLTRFVDIQSLIEKGGATISYERLPAMREEAVKLLSAAHSPQSGAMRLASLLCCLPMVRADTLSYENVFRLIIMKFMDRYDMDVRSVKKSCVHIVHPDGRVIPFDTYNLFYREGLESTWRRAAGIEQPVMAGAGDVQLAPR